MTNAGDRSEKYIRCSMCKYKNNYENNDGCIKANFGYKKPGERFETCMKCREVAKEYSRIYRKEYAEKKKDSNMFLPLYFVISVYR